MLVYGSVCSGIEAASVAWQGLGWRPAFFSEIDAFPRAVLAQRFGCGAGAGDGAGRGNGVPLHGDFTTIEEGQYEPIDLLVGGTPCQDFSVAGKRAGMDGERGNLTLDYARLAFRLRPDWLAWENVPGVFSLNAGRDFGAVIACFAGYPDGAIFEPPEGGWQNAGIVPAAGPDGYGLAWRVLDAQFAGVPQRRRRVFLVGYLGDWRPAAAVLLERHSLSGHPAPRRQAGQDVAGTLAARAGGGGRPDGGDGRHSQLIAFDLRGREGGAQFEGPHDTANIRASSGDSSRSYVAHHYAVRRLTPRECERLQGFPDDWTLVRHNGKPAADGPRYKALGNSMAVPVMRWIGERIALVDALLRDGVAA